MSQDLVTITFKGKEGESWTVQGEVGISILDLAHSNSVPLEGPVKVHWPAQPVMLLCLLIYIRSFLQQRKRKKICLTSPLI